MLIVKREPSANGCTLGKLYQDGKYLGETLEDVVREKFYDDGALVDPATWKIFGETAIPSGTYSIILSYSDHFKKVLPLLLGVPGFSGVRIHGGNTAADTEGCILVGLHRDAADNKIYDCAPLVETVIRLVGSGENKIQILPAACEACLAMAA